MNKNKKWYSLFLVAIILLSTLVQPIQAVATVVAAESEEIQANVSTLNNSEATESEAPTEETASQVVVESTESTEETSSTTENESSTTSEPTTETTDESTTQSTTEESDVDKDALKKARALATRTPVNINSLMEGIEKFITKVDLAVYEGDNKVDIETQTVSPNATISLKYLFDLPQRLIDKDLIKAGDYFETSLPSQLNVKNVNGTLQHPVTGDVFGSYDISNGKIRVTFNEKVEELNDITGEFFYSETLNQSIEAGENVIKIPVGSTEEIVNINVRPNGGQAISKNGSKGEDNKSISWDVSINTNLSQLKNATVTDPMPEGTTLKNLKIYTQTVDLSGKPKELGTELEVGKDYTLVDNVVTFIGQYANTNKSFKLVYSTTVNEDSIPAEGGEVKYKNTATLTNEGQSYPATSEVGISYGKLIDKSNAVRDTTKPGFVYNWTVKYNYGYKALPAKSSITDSLSGTNLEYVKESVVVTTAANETLTAGKDYTLSFKDKEMLVLFPNGLDTAVNINYQTKVPFIVDGNTTETSLKNNVKTDTGFSAGGSGQIAKDGVIKNADIDYNARTIKWTIIVNRYQYDMFNWSLKDTMSSGLTFNKDNFEITSDTGKLNEDVHYRFVSSDAQNFHVEFIGDLATKGTNKTYTITYTTEFDRYQEKFKNSATTTWEDSTKRKYTQGAEREVTVKPEYVKDATKGGSYNAVNKTITWTTVANYNQDVLKNATITDPIIGDQTYVEGSAKVFEAILKKDGTYSRGDEVTGLVTVTKDQVSAKLPEDSKKTYILVFETSLEGKVINKESYKNKATYVNNGKSTDVEASVTVKNGGVLASKSGEQDSSNANYAKWTVTINPTQSTLKDVKVVDKPSTNQVIDESSIAIYETTVSTNGDHKKNEQKKLISGTDYLIEITTNNESGEQVFTVSFVKEISRAYILEYRTLINSDKITDTLSNTISMTASNEKVEKWETSSSSKVSVSGGSATGSKASVKIVKLDKNTKERTPLPGAVFELWSIGNNNSKGTLVRSGETDAKGEIKFGNLRANYDYLLVETKAPEGFTVSEELKNGKKVRFKPDATNENSFEELAIQNDMPRIQFQKVDEKTNAGLAGAIFAVKNAKGEYYNGINAKYVAQWVSDKKDISNETKTQLTSGENGFVEVTGLNVGNYSIEELTAPVGYDRLSTAISFEVVNDAGMIRLKDAIQPIANKAYETTSLPVQKNWDDADNQDGIRPNEVVITLLADGEKTDKTLKLTKENGWKASFSGLRKFDADMKAIKYTAEEAEVEDYELTDTKNNNGVIEFTNTHKPELIDISGKKSWDDKENQDGIRPKTITVNLLANGKVVASKEVSAADKWAYTFNNQPKFANGVEITYSVTENEVPNYTTTYKDTDINNQYTPGERSISVSKVWDDADNQDGLRSKEVTVQLLADGKASGEVVTLNADNNWAHSWTKLAVKKAGEAVTYTVKEISQNKDYEAKVEETTTGNFTITNTHTPSIIKIDGKKVWEDVNNQDGIRPETITVNLLADGKKVTSQELTGSMTESDWTYSFEDLPEFKEGKKIVYTVEEEKVADYKTSIKGYTITNSYTPQITRVAVTKDWADANNQDGKRVKEIIVELYANGKATGNKLTLSSAEKWTASFEKLALKAAGKKIAYTVKELTNVEGYVAKVTSAQKNALSDELDVTVTNSYTPETLSINGEKIWDDADNQDGKRPGSITVNLLANGKKVADYEVNESTKWKYEFNELPKFENGVEIKYAVQEIKVEDYSATINGFDITNKHTPGKTAINVVKAWDDADDQDGIRPEGITVKLLANGKETDQTLILSDENKWQADFTDLDVYEKGKIIDYTIEEIEVDGYESAITGTSEEGFVVTNTHVPEETEVAGAKTWDDADNQDGIRPDSIVINLLADGEIVDSQEVTEETDWTYEFSELPKFKAGQEIVYSVSEEVVADYTATVNGFDITNTHKPEQTSIDVTKVWEDADNQDGLRAKEVVIRLLANGDDTKKTLVLNESNNWKDSFKGLDVYEAGDKIEYTVEEVKVADYESKITGSSKEGFVVTNTHEVALTEINVSKVWEDANDKDGIRPNSITVNLFANGKATGKTLVLTAKDKWKAVFKDLAVNENGKEIKYSVEEVAVKGYTSKVTGTSKTGFVVTNSHTPKEVPSKPSTSTPTKPKTTSNGNLPQTGEEQSILALSLGALMVVVVSAIYIQRRKENH